MIPYCEDGPCYASIFGLYLATLNEDFNENMEEGPVFYYGTKNDAGGKSRFTKSPIGKNTIAAVSKVIAEWLTLEHPEKYTVQAFR